MDKILVTGAAGFIGSHLMFALAKKGYDTIGLDNFNDFYDVELKTNRRKHFARHKILNVDIRNVYHLREVFDQHKPDYVIHLAAACNPRHSIDNPHFYHDNNIVGTQNIIDVCEEFKVKKIVYASTSSVCGGLEELPWKEDDKLVHQISPYGYTKYVNECQFKLSNLNSVGLRFFTVYGPWGRPDMALFKFTDAILNDKPITAFNEGNMYRDFTYIDDIINGIIRVFESKTLAGDIINIGRGEKRSLIDFINVIESNLNKKAKIIDWPMQKGDPYETLSDINKLSELGYVPKVSIEEGVSKFLNWYKSYYKYE